MGFPDHFLWGVATSAYQIEGAAAEDGRGESVWDRFCRTPGRIQGGDSGDVACDHYHRYAEDVDLMTELGVRGYRFSIGWSRVLPDGRGPVNGKGLDFYQRLVDRLLARGITPAITLNHWDMPQALLEAGGWPSRDTAQRFAEYAWIVFRALGDRVPLWITQNEPWCIACLGYLAGEHPPGVKDDLPAALRAAHHLLLGHGLAVEAFRGEGCRGQIGITLNLYPTYPRSDSAADADAARLSDGYTNRWFLDPVCKGTYPADMVEHYTRLAGPLTWIQDGDLKRIGAEIDFLGVNYYHPRVVEATPGQDLGWKAYDHFPGMPVTAMGWGVCPEGLHALLTRLKADYGDRPLYITESGAAYNDTPDADGQVHDPERVAYLRAHFAAAAQAIADGVNLRGYFVWSLLDNFEWAHGYSKRFGIVYVDYATQRRIPKDSARFLQQVIAGNGLP